MATQELTRELTVEAWLVSLVQGVKPEETQQENRAPAFKQEIRRLELLIARLGEERRVMLVEDGLTGTPPPEIAALNSSIREYERRLHELRQSQTL